MPRSAWATLAVVPSALNTYEVSVFSPTETESRTTVLSREAARGMRLDLPAGSSVRWSPGEVKEIGLVGYGADDEHPS